MLARRHGLSPDQADQLTALLTGLAEEVDPPTTIREPGEALRVHLADSLSGIAIPAVAAASRIADIGAGAGFPGLALAVALPGSHVALVESTARKCQVITRLAARAGLTNTAVIVERVEDHARGPDGGSYDVVTARAVAPLAVLAEYAAPLLGVGGHLVAWKGRRNAEEELAGTAAAAELGLELAEVTKVVPYAGARDHHLHVLTKIAPTPGRYPRRVGVARKRPIA